MWKMIGFRHVSTVPTWQAGEFRMSLFKIILGDHCRLMPAFLNCDENLPLRRSLIVPLDTLQQNGMI
jgi:hypothetical protein